MPEGAGRAVRHRRRRRAAAGARAADQEHHLEKHVLLAGFRPDVLSVHKAFDIFVMSSVTEGLGTSLLDAMACGKPVVATTRWAAFPRSSSNGETGFLVPPRDHEAMARGDRGAAERRARCGAHGRAPGCSESPRALQRRADGAGHASRVRARRDARAPGSESSPAGLRLPMLAAGLAAICTAAQARTCTPTSARTIVEGHRGAVLGKRHAAGDPRRRRAVGLDQVDLRPGLALVCASKMRSW